MHIIIVDDHPLLIKGLEALLTELDPSVTTRGEDSMLVRETKPPACLPSTTTSSASTRPPSSSARASAEPSARVPAAPKAAHREVHRRDAPVTGRALPRFAPAGLADRGRPGLPPLPQR